MICEYNQEACRVTAYNGKKSLIRSFPCVPIALEPRQRHSHTTYVVLWCHAGAKLEYAASLQPRTRGALVGNGMGSPVFAHVSACLPACLLACLPACMDKPGWCPVSQEQAHDTAPVNMFRNTKRPMSVSDTLASIMGVENAQDVYNIKDSALHIGIHNVSMTPIIDKSTEKKKSSMLSCDVSPSHRCCTSALPVAQWIEGVLCADRGVIAALPATESSPPRTMALDQRAASGHPEYWIVNMLRNKANFNPSKTSTALSGNSVTYESITMDTTVPEFIPNGDVFGAAVADTDFLVDAGFCMHVRMDPYVSSSDVVSLKTNERQVAACCTELAFQFLAAERGIAPAVLACFFAQFDHSNATAADGVEIHQKWMLYTKPKQMVDGDIVAPKEPTGVRSIVTVSQISTFSLDDLMFAIRNAPVQSKRDHLVRVMKSMCVSIFQKIKEISSVHNGYGMVKLNMTPASVVFCPELHATNDKVWTLNGFGYMPASSPYIDGMPRIVDYNSVFTARVRQSSHSFETCYAMSCMLMVAFSRAQHGAAVAEVLWQHLTEEGDPSGFVSAIRSIVSRSTNTSAFLACVVANADMRESPEVSKAVSGVVSDMDAIVRESVLKPDGSLRRGSETPMFKKLVSLVTGSSEVDTRIFSCLPAADTGGKDIDDAMEADYIRALDRVKKIRRDRLSVFDRLPLQEDQSSNEFWPHKS